MLLCILQGLRNDSFAAVAYVVWVMIVMKSSLRGHPPPSFINYTATEAASDNIKQ